MECFFVENNRKFLKHDESFNRVSDKLYFSFCKIFLFVSVNGDFRQEHTEAVINM